MANLQQLIKRKKKGDVLPDLEPIAVIDIGSNSVRLVIFEGAKLTPIPLFNEKCLCGLGRELATTGRLGDDEVERAYMALRRFRSVIDQIGVSHISVIATAAAREAENGPEFIEAAELICKTPIEVISGRREAQLAAAGVFAGDPQADGFAGDMGGGSLELIDINNRSVSHGTTMPLGGLRLIDQSGGDLKVAKSKIDTALSKLDWLKAGKDRPFYLVGGTWRAFVKLYMAHKNYPLRVLHGFEMPIDEVLDFASYLIREDDMKSVEGIHKISKQRRPVLPFGALALSRLIKAIEPSKIVTSHYGVREGLLYTLLNEEMLARDSLLAGCEDMANLLSRSPMHAFELCDWTDRLFYQCKIEETAYQRRLRHAACLVSDIGWRTHSSFRAEQTMTSIAYGVLSGIDHPGRAFLALSSFFRHKGPSGAGDELRLRPLLCDDLYWRARVVGAAIRSVHMISAGVVGIIPKTPLLLEDDKLVIELPHPFDALDGERLHRRFQGLGRLLDKETEIRVHPDSQFFGFIGFPRTGS